MAKPLLDWGKVTFWKWCARLATLTALLLAAVPAAAAWRKAETDNFILYSQSGEQKVREQAALLEDYHQFLRLLTGVDDPPSANKLRVYLVRGRSDLRQVRDVPAGVAGFYAATPSGIAAFVDDRGGGSGGDEEILFHEIAHHFMLQYRPTAYPAWFVEGFAEYVQTAKFTPKTIDYGQPSTNRVAWLSHNRWLPYDKVLFERSPRNRADSALYYAQSWLLAHYMMRDPARREKFRDYITALVRGTPPREAFAQQFGSDMKALNRAVENYAARDLTYTRMTRASAASVPAVKVETLPPSADALLLSDAALHVGVRDDYAPPLLARVRAAAAKFPDDPFARRVRAKAEILNGDRAVGEKLLDPLLKAQPQDAELLYLMGMRHLLEGRADDSAREARFKGARRWFVQAHKADKTHFPTLVRYAESLMTDRRYDSDNTMEILLLAQELAPQVTEIRLNAANLLLMRGRYAEAEALVLPLASAPHNEELATAAQALLAKARAKGKAPAAEESE